MGDGIMRRVFIVDVKKALVVDVEKALDKDDITVSWAEIEVFLADFCYISSPILLFFAVWRTDSHQSYCFVCYWSLNLGTYGRKKDFKSQISTVHEKIDEKFSILEEMLKKLLKSQPKTVSSETREATDNQGCGENPNPIRRREDEEVEILEGEERIPPLEPNPREEPGRGYGERHEKVGHERRGVEFERGGAVFERGGTNYDRRGVEFEMRWDDYDRMGAEFERRLVDFDPMGAKFERRKYTLTGRSRPVLVALDAHTGGLVTQFFPGTRRKKENEGTNPSLRSTSMDAHKQEEILCSTPSLDPLPYSVCPQACTHKASAPLELPKRSIDLNRTKKRVSKISVVIVTRCHDTISNLIGLPSLMSTPSMHLTSVTLQIAKTMRNGILPIGIIAASEPPQSIMFCIKSMSSKRQRRRKQQNPTRSIASIAEPIFVVANGTQNGFTFLIPDTALRSSSVPESPIRKTQRSNSQSNLVLPFQFLPSPPPPSSSSPTSPPTTSPPDPFHTRPTCTLPQATYREEKPPKPPLERGKDKQNK
ncbi:hypothetical protein M5K25_012348 [Dendrobium thyrsiflorum]|uniref:Uncharacterized protein n=1 Tax=Dendrobium thyrsiflorum TaxID=117978 RepID=A0ABD0UX75_DENTH